MTANNLSNLVITKVCTSLTIYNQKNTKGKRLNRERCAIIIKYEGRTTYHSGGINIVSDLNNVVFLPKGSCYEWECTESGSYSVIEFDGNIESDEIFVFSLKDGNEILKLFKRFEYNRTSKKTRCEMEEIRDCYTIILELMNLSKKKYVPTERQQKMIAAIEYIAKNYTKKITNNELAELSGMSTVYFRKLFSEVYGISPIAYVQKLRIKKAMEMLGSDYGSISDVAQSLGYLNIYDFSRAFKKHTGVPPSKYLKK